MAVPTVGRQSKNPIGLIETLRLVLPRTTDILAPLAAATLRAAANSPKKEAILDGRRKKHH
jgi:hypothetical protein